jgi:hypothetical protein
MLLSAQFAATALLLAAALTVGATACEASADGPLLFRDPPRQPATPPDAPGVVRARYVEVDFGVLGGENPSPANVPATLRLNLFPDATFTVERDGAQAAGAGRGVVWIGHAQGIPNSAVTLVVEDGVLVGNVQAAGHYYEVRYAGDDLHTVTERNPRTFGPD